MEMQTFIKERNEAFLSLDRKKIEAYAQKYEVDLPENDEIFWAGIHKARLGITSFSEDVKDESRKWLREHGFKAQG